MNLQYLKFFRLMQEIIFSSGIFSNSFFLRREKAVAGYKNSALATKTLRKK